MPRFVPGVLGLESNTSTIRFSIHRFPFPVHPGFAFRPATVLTEVLLLSAEARVGGLCKRKYCKAIAPDEPSRRSYQELRVQQRLQAFGACISLIRIR